MTYEDFKNELLISMGANLMDVELEDAEVRVAFNKAKRTFQQKGSNNMRREFFRLKVDKCNQRYSIPTNIDTIVKVIKPSTGFDVEDPLALATYNELFSDLVGNPGAGGFDFLSYEFILQRVEQFHKYMAYETQFHHDKHRHTIEFLDEPERVGFWILDCYVNLTDEEYMDVLWIQEWAKAEAMEMLDKAYGKFSALPSPDGGTVQLNQNLGQEAREIKERLLEDILNGWDADPTYYEISFG